MNFIPGHAIFLEKAIDPNLLKILVEKWNYYEIEKNANMIEYIWKILFPLIPKECEGKKLVGYDINSISLNKKIVTRNTNEEKIFERQKRGKNSKSLLTISIICNTVDQDFFRFYDDKKSNIKFSVPNADFFTVQHVAGNVILYTNKISYYHSHSHSPLTPNSTPSYCLKIPVYYSNEIPKTFEIPTPNGEKFNRAEFVDVYGNLVSLTADSNNPHTKERWEDVERGAKILKIQKYLLPSYINTKKGRPPTKKEDYCPNCYEIISLSENFTNCSGCLSPIEL